MKSSVPKKFRWKHALREGTKFVMFVDALGGCGGTLGHKIDQISCERPYEMKSLKKLR